MIFTTEGIVTHTLKYGESSIIARIFTREKGMQSYLVRGVRKSKTRRKQYLFQPLTLVNMVASHKEQSSLHYIKEIQLLVSYRQIPHQIEKSSLAIFISEVLGHALKNQEASEDLFHFVKQSMLQLDETRQPLGSFHLVFLLQLSKHLGFHPRNNFSRHCRYFNMQEGLFQNMKGHDAVVMNEEESETFSRLVETPMEEQGNVSIPKPMRSLMLDKTIDYYRYHLAGMPEIKSHSVLRTLFSG